jgi:hypothetical protein
MCTNKYKKIKIGPFFKILDLFLKIGPFLEFWAFFKKLFDLFLKNLDLFYKGQKYLNFTRKCWKSKLDPFLKFWTFFKILDLLKKKSYVFVWKICMKYHKILDLFEKNSDLFQVWTFFNYVLKCWTFFKKIEPFLKFSTFF